MGDCHRFPPQLLIVPQDDPCESCVGVFPETIQWNACGEHPEFPRPLGLAHQDGRWVNLLNEPWQGFPDRLYEGGPSVAPEEAPDD